MKKLIATLIILMAVSTSLSKEVKGVEILGINYYTGTCNYSECVGFNLVYKNNTNKKVTGIIVYITLKDTFGTILFQGKLKEVVNINPNSIKKDALGWEAKNNPYIKNELYDLLYPSMYNKSIRIKARVIKVVYSQ